MAFSWTCPFCSRSTTIVDENFQKNTINFIKKNAIDDDLIFTNVFILCPHPECKNFSLKVHMYTTRFNGKINVPEKELKSWTLLPQSESMVLPDYIPAPIAEDYYEACQIKDLSPKASATLSRRCLQGMIRDFFKVSKRRLIDEIEAIKEKVDPLTWEAIDAVRQIGNIGAHMEKDINIIVDVEPNEAQLLIELIETLIKDWYITRYDRQKRMTGLVTLAGSKAEMRKPVIES